MMERKRGEEVMAKYKIITDSTCDLDQAYVDAEGVVVLPLSFRICGQEYINYLDGREQSSKDFYDLMRKGESATTAQLNIADIQTAFRKELEAGYDLLVLGFSSGLSGSYNAMRIAKEEIQEEFKDSKIMLIDSLCASGGEGLFVYHGVENKKKGMSIEENYETLLKLRPHLVTWFTVDDIDTLYRGGRLSGGAAVMAKFLHIKPVLKVDDEGHLQAIYKKVGRKQAMVQLVDSTMKTYDRTFNQCIIIGHADALEDATVLKKLLQKALEKDGLTAEIKFINIGPVIGAHAGPGTLLIASVGSAR